MAGHLVGCPTARTEPSCWRRSGPRHSTTILGCGGSALGLYGLAGDTIRARRYADSARLAIERQLSTTPDDEQHRLFLGLALAIWGSRWRPCERRARARADRGNGRPIRHPLHPPLSRPNSTWWWAISPRARPARHLARHAVLPLACVAQDRPDVGAAPWECRLRAAAHPAGDDGSGAPTSSRRRPAEPTMPSTRYALAAAAGASVPMSTTQRHCPSASTLQMV